ncbi:alpha/beta fold hydrolase [Arenimonas sp.]|uniref:alpha/beta hydrolase family protein n=1 Tax=Arenimonas sp. TaxID=1872635 RepID=UPI0039E5B97A
MSDSPDVVETRSPDGHACSIRLWRAGTGASTLVWLPALGVPAAKYDAFAASLQGRGLNVAVHEWRGTGSSSWRPARRRDWGYRELLELDIPLTIATARQHLPGDRWVLGGHSLGGQLAALSLAMQPHQADALLLIATGVPAARYFPGAQALGVRLFAHALRPLTRILGSFPGNRLNWAGHEAGQVMRDWASTVVSGQYRQLAATPGIDAQLRSLQQPALGIRFSEDWLVPEISMSDLLGRIGSTNHESLCLDEAALSARADHFRWMRQPDAVADAAVRWLRLRLA